MGPFSKIFIALALVIAAPYYWFLLDARTSAVPTRTIDIAALRKLAALPSGPRPTAIAYAPLTVRKLPGTLLVAGGGLRTQPVAKVAFRLITPGGDTLVDVGPNRAQAEEIGFDDFNTAARRQVDGWMASAKRIVFTHEHPDFVGGFTTSPAFDEIATKVVLNQQQAETMDRMRPGVKAQVAQVIRGDAATPIAPGVVLLPAPGHSRGSQMIYVQLADGREYLFPGDTAAMRRNVTWLRPRSRLASAWQGGEDREAVIGWLKGLAELQREVPSLTIVYASDLVWLQSERSGPHFATAFRYVSGEGSREAGHNDDAASDDTNN